MIGSDRIFEKFSPAVAISILVVTLLLILMVRNITINTSFDAYLPHEGKYKTYQEVNRDFGGDKDRMIIYISARNADDSVLSPGAIREELNLSKSLSRLPGISRIVSAALILNYAASSSLLGINQSINNMSDMEIENLKTLLFGYINGDIHINTSDTSNELYLNTTYLKKAVSSLFSTDLSFKVPNPHATVIICYYNNTLTDNEKEEITRNILDTIANTHFIHINVETTGMPQVSLEVAEETIDNMKMLSLISLVSVLVMLIIAFRSIKLALLGLLTVFVSILWTMAAINILGYPITTVDVVVVPVIIGLGIDYTIHIIRRSMDRGGMCQPMAGLEDSLVPISAAMLTTAVAFSTNLLSNLEPMKQLGITLAIGIFISYFMSMSFLPALLYIFRGKVTSHKGATEETIRFGILQASKFVRRFPFAAVSVFLILLLPSIWGMVHVKSDFSVNEFLPEDWDSLRTRDKVIAEFDGAEYSSVYVVIEGDMFNPQVLKYARNVTQAMEDDHKLVKVQGQPALESIFTYMEILRMTDSRNYSEIDGNGDLVPDSREEAQHAWTLLDSMNITDPLFNDNIRDRMRGVYWPQGNKMIIRAYYEMVDAADAKKIEEDIKSDLGTVPPGTKVEFTGYAIFVLETMNSIRNAQIESTLIAVIISTAILFILYRSWVLTLASMVPVVVSAIFLMGSMYYFNISFNVLSASVLALTIGLGIDYSIYLVHEFKNLIRKKNFKQVDAYLVLVYSRMGTMLYFSSATTILGFFILILSPLPLIRSYGFLASEAIVFSVLTSMIIVPILSGIWATKKYGKEWTSLKPGELLHLVQEQIRKK